MISSLVFAKKCKKLIVDNNLDQTILNIENVFYEFLKEFKGKDLDDAFNYYLDIFDFESNNAYEFINKLCPMIDLLYLEDTDFNFNNEEKQLIINIFDSAAESLDLEKLNELASTLMKIRALN